MIKKLLLALLLVLMSVLGFSQDIIIKKNGEEIKAKVIEVYEAEIHYKKYNNQEGPTFIAPTSSISQVKYENGDVEYYTNQTKSRKPQTRNSSEEIIVRSGQFYYQGRQISTKKVKQLFAKYSADEAITEWNKSQISLVVSYAANVLSYPVILVSYFNPFAVFLDPTTAFAISIGGYFVSAGLQVVYYWKKTVYKNQRIEAIELYNDVVKQETLHPNDDYY